MLREISSNQYVFIFYFAIVSESNIFTRMGKVMSLLMKPVKKFNVESRAHKVISREKPIPAPLHKSTHKQLEIAQATNPTFMETHYKKDPELDDRLKNVYVNSSEPQVAQDKMVPDRPLPVLTRSGSDFPYGFWTPEKTSEGKCTLGTALQFMTNNLEDPVKNSSEIIASEYKLDITDVENVLEYYRILKVTKSKEDGRQIHSLNVLELMKPGQIKEK